MASSMTTARTVGALFILADICGFSSMATLGPILGHEDKIAVYAANPFAAELTTLVVVAMEAFCVGIAVLMFPILRRVGDTPAIGYVAARTMEALLIFLGTIAWPIFLALGHTYAQAGAPVDPSLQPLGTMLSVANKSLFGLANLPFSISALILNAALFRGRIVPSWLTIWGLIGGVLALAEWKLSVFGIQSDILESVMMAPLALNEIALAIWLIVKGFDLSRLQTA